MCVVVEIFRLWSFDIVWCFFRLMMVLCFFFSYIKVCEILFNGRSFCMVVGFANRLYMRFEKLCSNRKSFGELIFLVCVDYYTMKIMK